MVIYFILVFYFVVASIYLTKEFAKEMEYEDFIGLIPIYAITIYLIYCGFKYGFTIYTH